MSRQIRPEWVGIARMLVDTGEHRLKVTHLVGVHKNDDGPIAAVWRHKWGAPEGVRRRPANAPRRIGGRRTASPSRGARRRHGPKPAETDGTLRATGLPDGP